MRQIEQEVTQEKVCEYCRFYNPIGLEDSGIPAHGQVGNWEYPIGECTYKKPEPGMPDGNRIPSWQTCWKWKK